MSKCYSHDDTGCYSMVGPSQVECTINGNCWGTSDACCPELKKNTGCKSVPGSDSCSCKCYENGDAEPCNNNITKCAATCSNWGSKNCLASNNINNNTKKLGDNSSQNTGLSGIAILAIVIGSMIVVLLVLGFFMKGNSGTKKRKIRTRFKNH